MLHPLRQKPICGATVLGWCLVAAKLALMLTMMFSAQGCASTKATAHPAETIVEVRTWWDRVCGAGHDALTLAANTAERLPADAAPDAAADASTESDR
jgi:hypothetical protein